MAPPSAENGDSYAADQQFMQFVFTDVQNMWVSWFDSQGLGRPSAAGILLKAPTNTGCGEIDPDTLNAAYCPPDDTVYIPMETIHNAIHGNFFGQINDSRLTNAAAAFVVAHEYGHNVHNELYANNVYMTVAPEPKSKERELFADCAAGVWGFKAYYSGYFEPGDLSSILAGAAALADAGTGKDPHGSPEERDQAFLKGYNSGSPWQCATTYLGSR